MKKILLCLLLALPCYGQRGFMAPALGLRNVVPEGLVGYWQMDEAGGNVVRDLSGNGNTGYLTNSPTWTNGVVGTALGFNGVNQGVSISNATSLSLTSVTICAWVKLNSIATISAISVDYKDSSSLSYTLLYNTNTQSLYCGFSNNGNDTSSYREIAGAKGQIQTNVWFHAVAVIGGTTNKLFLNGEQTGTNGPSGYVYASASNKQIGMLRYTSSLLWPMAGSIDNVRIYNRALSAAEVSKIYQAEKGSYTLPNVTDGLVGWYKFDGNASDSSGNGNDGTANNSPSWVSGAIGGAVYTRNGCISVLNTNAFNFGSNYTFSAWAMTDADAQRYFMYVGDGTGATRDWFIYTCGTASCLYHDAHILDGFIVVVALSTTNWNHITVTSSNNVIRGYANGNYVGASSVSASPIPPTTVIIGGGMAVTDKWRGKVDDARFYNRALSAAEVLQLYNWRP